MILHGTEEKHRMNDLIIDCLAGGMIGVAITACVAAKGRNEE